MSSVDVWASGKLLHVKFDARVILRYEKSDRESKCKNPDKVSKLMVPGFDSRLV